MTKFKYYFVILAVSLSGILMANVNTAACAPADNEAKEVVTKAFKNYAELKSYRMVIDSRASFSLQGKEFSVITTGECDINNKPVVVKNVLTITMETLNRNSAQKIEQYIEEAGDKFIAYSKINNQWEKQSVPIYSPLREYENYFKAIKQVTPVRDTADSTVYAVLIDGGYVQESIERSLGPAAKGLLPLELFKDIGDFKYLVTIDKKTAAITKMKIDISELFSRIGDKLAEAAAVPDEQKELVKEVLKSMKMVTSVTFSRINAVGKLAIPPEALNALTQQANTLPPTL